MLPFTRQEFFEGFAAYNSANWVAAVAAYPLALMAIALAWRGTRAADRWVSAVLALMWSWVAVVYQWLHFSLINPAAKLFALAFLVQAALFAMHAALGRGLEYRLRSQVRTVTGTTFISYALIGYPLIGLLAGERYPAMPLFGMAPCPLLIFTFGLLVWATHARWWLWIVPMLWSIVGGSASIFLSVPQDSALPISAIVALLILFGDRSPVSAVKHP